MKDRTQEKKIKNFWSDEEEESESEEEVKREIGMEDYEFVKAQRTRARIAIVKFVKKFKEENQRNPTDADTAAIAMELDDYNRINQQYLDTKLQLLKEEKMPFEPEEFVDAEAAIKRTTTVAGPSQKLQA